MLLTLLAQASPSPSASPRGGLGSLLPFVILLGGMYLLMIRPQRNRMKAAQALASTLAVGDEVQTAGGMFGTIVRMDDAHAWVEFSPGVEIKFLRRAIVGKVEPTPSTGEGQA